MAALPKIVTGPDAQRAIRRREAADLRKDAWPYTHLFPPPDADTVHGSDLGIQAVAVPASGAQVVACSYLVPSGNRFIMAGILQDFEGTFIPGDTSWTVFENPNNGKQANPVQGLINTKVPLGSWRYGTIWPFFMPYEFAPLTLLRSIATNGTPGLNAGPPNQYVTGFFGWLVPGL